MFFPDEDKIHLEISKYKESSEKIGGSNIGDMYHIILFKNDTDPDFDKFEAILACPITYASRLIPAGFFGLIAKKTETSHEFVSEIYERITKDFY
jgi:hypothetical protein